MSYTITDGDRCPVRMYSAAQCVLRDDHDYHHVTAGGAHFRGAGRRPVAPKLPESLPAWFAAGDRVMGQSFDQWAQDQGIAPASLTWEQQFDVARVKQARTELHDRISVVVQTQNKRDQQRADEFAAFKAGVEKTLEHLADQASRHANTLGALGQTCDRLERTLGVESRERAHLGNRIIALEKLVPTKYDNDAAVVMESVVRQLQDRLAELEQRLELPPAVWGIQSSEPPRHQTYQDTDGDLWQCRDGRWYCVRDSGTWTMGGDGFTWPFSNHSVNRKYFPWKVWNGRD